MRAKLCPKARETALRIFQVDTFTATRFTGNPAIVVLDADGQNDATLAAVAREFSHAEVVFVFAADAVDAWLAVRSRERTAHVAVEEKEAARANLAAAHIRPCPPD